MESFVLTIDMSGDFQPSGDYYLDTLLTDHLTKLDMLRAMRTKVLYTKATKPGVFEMRVKGLSPAAVMALAGTTETRAKYDIAAFLNALPVEQAFALYTAS